MKRSDEKVTIIKTHELLGLDVPRRNEEQLECPLCGKKKLGVNFNKDAFQCFSCGAKGHGIHYWALQRGLDISDTKAAAKDFYAYIGGADDKPRPPRKKIAMPPKLDVPIANIETRNKTYTTLLDLLVLNEKHRQNLLQRGLSDEAIQKNGYKSNPAISHSKIAQTILECGCVLDGVPGFYKDDKGEWTFVALGSGYLIPQRDGRGRIQGMQIRKDNVKEGGTRYVTVSTPNQPSGARARANCHFAKGESIENVIVTEGPLKADIITYYTGYSVLGVQGVNCLTSLTHALEDLRTVGLETVTIAYDMDLYDNPKVAKALSKLKTSLEEMRLPYTFLHWDKDQKGLDDWLHEKISSKKKTQG